MAIDKTNPGKKLIISEIQSLYKISINFQKQCFLNLQTSVDTSDVPIFILIIY